MTKHAVISAGLYNAPKKAHSGIAAPKNSFLLAAPGFSQAIIHRKASCACGGGCPACRAEPSDLRVSQPKAPAEIEADQIADQAIRMQRSDSGKPLDESTRIFMEPRFNYDFSKVKIHDNNKAAQSAGSLNALAYTSGNSIVFNSGQYKTNTDSGRHLLAHELAHVVQQSNTIRRRIRPEDVSGQMIGQNMTVTSSFNAPTFVVPSGSVVEILTWFNSLDTVNVQLVAPQLNAHTPFDIPKISLRPTAGSSGLHQYSSGIEATVSAITAGDARITQESSRPGGPRPGEIPRLQALQRNRQKTLNARLIQQEMFNRFDVNIVNWVNFYNTQFAASGFGNLDANLVKAMFFQESEMGTSGQFMSLTPANREMGIHNLGQVIDSSASALLILIREIEPALITRYHLQNIARDTASRPAGVGAEDFMWNYVAAGETQGFQDAVNDFYATAGGGMRDTSYDFWIQAAVRWLFEKRRTVSSWAEAIRAYNGSGARARHYRDAVTGRSRDAATAASQGHTYIPHR